MEWAAGNLLKQDWPTRNKELQAKAEQKLHSLARILEGRDRKEEGQRLLDVVLGQRQRDLVVKLSWQGEADLDLKVVEPSGSVCSTLNRQTVGGGTLVGDVVGGGNEETYMAAEAFPGEYEVKVDRVWGKPLGGKAQLKIVLHQGTPDESERLVTVDVKAGKGVRFRVDAGRRTETAYVPPREAIRLADDKPAPAPHADQVLADLRAAADPEVTGFTRGFSGNVGSGRAALVNDRKPAAAPSPGRTTRSCIKPRSAHS